MSEIAIRTEKLSKRYKLGAARHRSDSLKELLAHGLTELFHRDSQPDTIWALKDVSFEVKQGKVVGIIGRNGAGKSTLLKILSRITEPTVGRAQLHGRVGSLVEVGTGFDRELTGRENIYLNGAILGMRKKEIDRRFDEIVDFSGVEAFIDQPLKRYSSGMYVRLGFAVAAHLNTDILLVDEVLAVGDIPFQKKCLNKMRDAATGGRTVLLVSHNMAAIEHLCHQAIVLHGGELAFTGSSREATDYYLHSVSGDGQQTTSHTVDLSNAPGRVPGFRPLLKHLELFTDADRPLNGYLKVGDSLKAYISFQLEYPTSDFDLTLRFDNLLGQCLFTAHTIFEPNYSRENRVGEQMFLCDIPSLTLVPGEYMIQVALDINASTVDAVEDATRLTIVDSDYYGTGKMPWGSWGGAFVLKHHWRPNERF